MATADEEAAARAYVAVRRESTRRSLNGLYLPYYDALCEALEGTYWAPFSGLRTNEEQLKLYQQGRTPESLARGERVVTNARPGDSAHNWGCGTDWVEWRPEFKGRDLWNKANWAQYAAAVRRVGLVWGGDWDRDGATERGEDDFPHNQLAISEPWRAVGDVYRKSGEQAALDFIALHKP